MKLYWGRHTCAIGIHILLEEVGAAFETVELDVAGGENRREPFRTIDPKQKVPALLRDDGSVLTEFGAIATWVALANPGRALIPDDVEDRVRMVEAMDYTVGTLHGQGFHRVFRPGDVEPKDLLHRAGLGRAAVQAEGMEMARAAFAVLDRRLDGRPYLGGRDFSIADAALFYCERWAPRVEMALPPNVAAHFDRMRARPSVRRALEFYGEA